MESCLTAIQGHGLPIEIELTFLVEAKSLLDKIQFNFEEIIHQRDICVEGAANSTVEFNREIENEIRAILSLSDFEKSDEINEGPFVYDPQNIMNYLGLIKKVISQKNSVIEDLRSKLDYSSETLRQLEVKNRNLDFQLKSEKKQYAQKDEEMKNLEVKYETDIATLEWKTDSCASSIVYICDKLRREREKMARLKFALARFKDAENAIKKIVRLYSPDETRTDSLCNKDESVSKETASSTELDLALDAEINDLVKASFGEKMTNYDFLMMRSHGRGCRYFKKER